MKNTCINAMAVALCVFSYIQMERANADMEEVRTEMSCPTQTTIKPFMPLIASNLFNIRGLRHTLFLIIQATPIIPIKREQDNVIE
jgi:hypothetical protein